MKFKIIFFTLLTVIELSGCTTTKTSSSKLPNNLDEQLLGSWKGSEKNQLIEGIESTWVQHRFENGEFILLAIYTELGEIIYSGAEKGKWWVNDGLFHELHYSSGKTDIYEYEILDANRVKFRAKKITIESNAEIYEFIDARIEE